MTRRALVVAHRSRHEAVVATGEVLTQLAMAGLEAVMASDEMTADQLPDVEMAIVLGGDGTILRAAELTRAAGVPLLGINLGHIGFLAEIEPDNVPEAVRRMASGDFVVEERSTLQVRVITADGAVIDDWALNEAALEKSDTAKMLEIITEVDGRPLSSFGTDGIVIATPTGSTAHAFSAGGPVVWPDVDGLIVVPVVAHALFARPLVIGPASRVAVEVLDRSPVEGTLTCDGRRSHRVPHGARMEVWRGDQPVRLARLSPAPFTTRLVSKFDLSVDGWRGAPTAGGRQDGSRPGPRP